VKPPREWSIEDVLGLPAGEQDWFERKGSKALDLTLSGVDENRVRSGLSVTLSAMANSGGGQIIYGLTDTGQVDMGGVSRAVKQGTKAWLEDIIPKLVEFNLQGFSVFEISDLSTTAPRPGKGKSLYVIDVPDSETAPHQATDQRYYGRVGGKSRPLPHRFVLDIMNRRKYPLVEPIIEPVVESRTEQSTTVRLRLLLKNRGPIRARDYLVKIKLPASLPVTIRANIADLGVEEIDGIGYRVWGYTGGPVTLFPNFRVEEQRCVLGFVVDQMTKGEILMGSAGRLKLRWETYADDMPPRKGEIDFLELLRPVLLRPELH